MRYKRESIDARDAIILEWLKARAILGSRKELARRLGIAPKTLESAITRLRERMQDVS